MKVAIPFSGFYETHHNAVFDDAIEHAFSELDTTLASNLAGRVTDECNWTAVHHAYATEYAERFFQEFLDLKLVGGVELISPREYNFETDRIIVEVSLSDMGELYELAMDRGLAELVHEELAPRSGFVPFHSQDIEDWGPVQEWEPAQAEMILKAMAGADFDHSAEADLMESASGNGLIDNWLYTHCPNLNFYADVAEHGLDVVLDTALSQRTMTSELFGSSARFVRFGNYFIMVVDAYLSRDQPDVEQAAEIAIDWMLEYDPAADMTDYTVV
jgi:hypothetical protein